MARPSSQSQISTSPASHTAIDIDILGPYHFISHVSLKEDGAYNCNNAAMRYFIDKNAPSSNQNTQNSSPNTGTRTSLQDRVRRIQNRRPFRWFNHPEHLDSIVAGCLSAGHLEEHLLRSNVILTWRGILTRIFLGESVTLHLSLIAGILFMEEEDPKPKWRARQYALGDAIGMAFEDAYTRSDPIVTNSNAARNKGRVDHVHTDTQWGNVVSRSLGDLNLIFCGEVDAVRGPSDVNTNLLDHRVELKCTSSNGRKKPWPRWHMQSHLLGVPEIFIGYRNDDHDIVRTEIVYTEDIKPKKFEDDIERGYRVLSSLREHLSTEQQGDGMKVSNKSDSDLQSAMIGLNLNLDRPRHEPSSATQDTGQLKSDDCIWKVTIKKWSFDAVEQLNAADAQNVKKRREDPSRPIERIGIIPKAFVDAIRASVKGDVS